MQVDGEEGRQQAARAQLRLDKGQHQRMDYKLGEDGGFCQ
jgi:hypothetical protein